ncbi:MAG: SCO family protein [Betaproteobacteria bacterium]
MDKRQFLRWMAITGVIAGGSTILAGCFEKKPSFVSIDLTGADYARDFSLPDQNGKVRGIKEFAGKVVVVFFGYTQCPDVCPTTMAELVEVRNSLGKDGQRVQGIFVSVDPERDTPEVLKAYIENFDPSFIALRPTSPEQLEAIAKDFKVFYKRVDGRTPTSYTMDHSAGSYIYDTHGQLRLYSRYGMGAKALAGDIEQLLKQAS